MPSPSKHNQSGFTLVELAIVLVIIGLIVSSVLVGQDLIRSAELRATTRQYQEFQTAVGTFIGKYGKLPGDIDGDLYGLDGGCDAGTNGDGDQDGILEDAAGASGATATLDHDGEILCFWANLTSSGKELIPGDFDGEDATAAVLGEDYPEMKFGGAGWGVYGTSANVAFYVTGVQAGNAFDTVDAFVPVDAFNIDSKIDDGVPSSGQVVTVSQETGDTSAPNTTDPGQTTPSVGNSHCYEHDLTPTGYYFAETAASCNLRFDMNTF